MITLQLDKLHGCCHGLFLETYIVFNYKIIERKKCYSSMQSSIVIKPDPRVDPTMRSDPGLRRLTQINSKKLNKNTKKQSMWI
jgi:hypothetical protein